MKTREKKGINESWQRVKCILTDWFTTFLAFLCFDIFRYYYIPVGSQTYSLGDYIFSPKLIMEQFCVPTGLLFIYWLSGYYNRPLERSRLNEFLLTFYCQIFNAVLIYMASLSNDQMYMRRESLLLLIVLFLLLFIFTYVGRIIVTEKMNKALLSPEIPLRTVIIGLSEKAKNVAERIRKGMPNRRKAEIVAFMPFGNEKDQQDSDSSSFGKAKMLSDIEGLKALCQDRKVDQVIIVSPPGKSPTNKVLHFLYHLYPLDVSIKINPDILSLITPSIRMEDILGEPFIDISKPRIGEFQKNVKRTFDVIASVLGLIVLSPVFAAAAISVKLSGPGKILYRQERIGLQRRPFNILKFRSMVPEAESDGVPRLSEDADARITAAGRWMRKYRIDELPQFWNVLKGDMSLVGPRPEREYFIEKIVKKAPWYALVHQVKPGITSWGMVKYGYATDIDQMIERNRYDLIYLTNMSIAVDFKILIHTIRTVGAGKGQ